MNVMLQYTHRSTTGEEVDTVEYQTFDDEVALAIYIHDISQFAVLKQLKVKTDVCIQSQTLLDLIARHQ